MDSVMCGAYTHRNSLERILNFIYYLLKKLGNPNALDEGIQYRS